MLFIWEQNISNVQNEAKIFPKIFYDKYHINIVNPKKFDTIFTCGMCDRNTIVWYLD